MADQIPDWAQDAPTAAPSPAPQASATGGAPDWAADPAAPAAPVSKPFKDEDFPEYSRLVRTRGTTPEQLTTWLEERGYGRSTNAAEVLIFHRRNPRIAPVNTYTQNPADPAPAPQPDGMPQPGTATDWLPDFIQAPIERLGLSLGIIDPKTYYGLGNYGPNARAPNRPTTISNPALPTWGQRFVRSMSETFDPAGEGINAYLLRANKDIADDDAIRHYGSDHNWTGDQIDAAIREAQAQRARAYAETREQRAIRDNDEVRRAEGLGVDETGKARSSWSGYLSRGSADLAGSIVGDANPTYVFAPEIKGAGALLERAAPAAGRLLERVLPNAAGRAAVPVAERVAAAAAPTAGRAAGQGAVQATTNLGTQADEVQRGLRENIDPVEVVLHGALGAGLQGGAEFLGKLAPQLSRWIVGKLREPSALDRMVAEGFDPADLPPGVTPKDAMAALTQLRGIRDEAANFRGTPEPKPTDLFPTDASRAADAEAWGRSLGEPTPRPAEPAPVTPEPAAPVAEPGPTDMTPQSSRAEFSTSEPAAPEPAPISRKEADAQFSEATGKPQTQTPAQWGKSLEEQAAAWKASRDAGSTEPAPSAATRNATAEAPPAETPVPAAATPPSDAAPAPEPAAAPSADDVVARLTTALSQAGKATEEQKRLYAQERGRRFAAGDAAIKNLSGQEAVDAAKKNLSGELPKADFESVIEQFSPEEIASLQDVIKNASTLTLPEKVTAWEGLRRLMHGEHVRPSELNTLSQVFPTDFLKAAAKNRSGLAKARSITQEVWNLPKSLMSTADLSAPLRQGIGLIYRKEWRDSFVQMHKYLVSDEAFKGLENDIKNSPDFLKMKEGGLSLPGVYGGVTEDAFSSHLAQKIPLGIGKINAASERAYVGFLTKLRADTFSNMLKTFEDRGLDTTDPHLLKSLGKFINSATGRGDLGRLEAVSNELNMVFFSPRMLKARVDTFNPSYYRSLHPAVRAEAIKSAASVGAYWAAAPALLTLAGFTVETDPKSSDFMKAKRGDQRLDFSGGYAPLVTTGAKMLLRQAKSLSDGEIRELRRQGDLGTDAGIKFLRNKLGPSASLLVDAYTGSNSIGEKFSWGPSIAQRAVPMSLPDVLKAVKDEGINAAPVAALAMYGVNLQNFDATQRGKREMKYPFTNLLDNTASAPAPAPAQPNTPIPDWAK